MRNEDHDDLDRILNAALAAYAAQEPRAGMEQRVLARLASHHGVLDETGSAFRKGDSSTTAFEYGSGAARRAAAACGAKSGGQSLDETAAAAADRKSRHVPISGSSNCGGACGSETRRVTPRDTSGIADLAGTPESAGYHRAYQHPAADN